MKNIPIIPVIVIILGLMLVSCQSKKAPTEQAIIKEGIHQVTAKEVLYASNYSYILVEENGDEYWIAIPYTEIEIGKTYFYHGGMAMEDFQSKDLDRVFDLVYFVDELFDEAPSENTHAHPSHLETGRQPIEQVEGILVEPAPGGIKIADLYASSPSYQGKTVIVRGQVVKVNEGIMGRNWVHLQDGSQHEGKYDLTVTTNVLPKVGNVITIEGEVAIDRDFGAGYTYDVILEDGRIVPAAL